MAAITWTDALNVSVAGGVVTKNGGANDTPNAGARSSIALSADGSVEVTIDAFGDFYLGLDPASTLETTPANLDYAFEFVESGTVNFRESGVFQDSGSFAGSVVAKFTRLSGVVTMYLDGTLVFMSATPSSGDVYVHALILDIGDSISSGTITSASIPTLPEPVAVTQTNAPTSYPNAVRHKNTIPWPLVMPTPPARGDTYLDVAYNQYRIRGTDGNTGTLPARLNRSHRMPSAAPCSVWSRDSAELYGTTSPSGLHELFSIDRSTDSSLRGRLTFVRDLAFDPGKEPTFSRVTARRMFGVSGYKVQEHNTVANTYTDLMDLAVVDAAYTGGALALGGTVQSSMSNPERIVCFYGGTGQDHHFRCMVFDRNALGTRLILDTQDGTVNGVAIPGGAWQAFLIHSIGIDLSGQYVLIFSTQQSGDPIAAVWDVVNGTVALLDATMHPFGHIVLGWKEMVNNESFGDSPYFSWQMIRRPLSDLTAYTKVFSASIGAQVNADSHYGNESVQATGAMLVLVNNYKYMEDIPENLNPDPAYRINTILHGPLDREVYDVDITTGEVYRHFRNLADTYADDGVGVSGFWYQPMAHKSPDGRFIADSTNLWKQLGLDASNDPNTVYRADIFITDLQWEVGSDVASLYRSMQGRRRNRRR